MNLAIVWGWGLPSFDCWSALRGVWIPQGEALFDVRVASRHWWSFLCQSPLMAVLASAEEKCKLFMYYWIVLCLFYTFCCVSWWVLGHEALMLLIAGSIFQSSCLVLGVRVIQSCANVSYYPSGLCCCSSNQSLLLWITCAWMCWWSGSSIDDGADFPHASLA